MLIQALAPHSEEKPRRPDQISKGEPRAPQNAHNVNLLQLSKRACELGGRAVCPVHFGALFYQWKQPLHMFYWCTAVTGGHTLKPETK